MRATEIISRVNALLDHAPHRAYALLVRNSRSARRAATPSERAQLVLLRARALNAITEFHQAQLYCDRAFARLEHTRGAESHRAQLCLEGAYAELHLDHLGAAENWLERARAELKRERDSQAEITWRVEWLAARIEQARGNYADAAQRLETLYAACAARIGTLTAARLRRDVGYAYSFTEPARARTLLEQARDTFAAGAYPIDAALCDVWSARIQRHYGDFARARALYAASRQVFSQFELGFYVAWCDLGLGWVEWGGNKADAAIPYLERARAFFSAAGARGEAASCEINLASIYLERYRYADALPLLQHALELARASGRRKQAAVCLLSIAWAYDHQGQYARAIEHYTAARAEYPATDAVGPIVCDLYLGLAYLNLGQFSDALTMLNRAARLARARRAKALYAEAEVYRAQTLLALRRARAAQRALWRARQLLTETRQRVYVAFCDRLLAQTMARDKKQARARLHAARRAFHRAGQPIELALCDLTQGELELAWNEWTRARRSLQHAQEQLALTHPDLMWRVEYGFGQIARAGKQFSTALEHELGAVRRITHLRADLRLEEWSNSVFGARHRVFDDALALARHMRANETALEIVEAAKAQIAAQLLRQRNWRAPDAQPEQRALADQEHALRQEIAALRGQLAMEMGQWHGELWSETGAPRTALQEQSKRLQTLSAAHDALLAQLRLQQRALAGAPELKPFSLEDFRHALAQRHGAHWAAVNYYLVRDQLTMVVVDMETVEVQTVHLSSADKFMLASCTVAHPEMRERIYRGTLRGQPVADITRQYLETLGAKLLPARLRAADNLTLIISPHGILHRLPFHALMQNNAYWLERMTCVDAPSFQILTQLYNTPSRASTSMRQLLCGAAEFGTRAHPLEHTRAEIQALGKHAPQTTARLWQRDATRDALLQMNRSGSLAEFDVLHFATHALVEPRAPHLSRILLADDDLTVADVLDLRLNARLVTLSACGTGLSAPGAGDELVGLTRAFFYAGARAMAASLWQVDDQATGALMQRFYAHARKGDSLAGALRAAQLELERAGLPPFYWAPFLFSGAE